MPCSTSPNSAATSCRCRNSIEPPIRCPPMCSPGSGFRCGSPPTMGGAIVDSGKFPWQDHVERFAMFCEPDASYHGLVYVDRFGPAAYIARWRSVYRRATGSVLAPLSAFLLLQGIETVALRIER